jgi:hypothetical protein
MTPVRHSFEGPEFSSVLDERSFFLSLKSIPYLNNIKGQGTRLFFEIHMAQARADRFVQLSAAWLAIKSCESLGWQQCKTIAITCA